MKTIYRYGLSLVFACSAALALPGERRADIEQGLAGTWVLPAGPWDGRAVLLLHGMASGGDEVGDLFREIAGRLAVQGIASLRFTFRGEGRDNTVLTSTFHTRLADAAAARQWLTRQPGVDPARIGVLGFSLGASTAIETGAREPTWFRSMAVWSSPSGDLFAATTTGETARRAMRDGEATEEIPGWKALTTKREFYESFRGFDGDVSLAKFPGAFLTVRGSQDYLPPRDAQMIRLAPGRPVEAVLIGGANHIFNVFEPALGHAERVLVVTVDWFERTL